MDKEDKYWGFSWDQLRQLKRLMEEHNLSFSDVLVAVNSSERQLRTARKRYEQARTQLTILECVYGKDKQDYSSSSG